MMALKIDNLFNVSTIFILLLFILIELWLKGFSGNLASSKISGLNNVIEVTPNKTRDNKLMPSVKLTQWASYLIRSFAKPILIGFRKRSVDLNRQLAPNSQPLMQFAGNNNATT